MMASINDDQLKEWRSRHQSGDSVTIVRCWDLRELIDEWLDHYADPMNTDNTIVTVNSPFMVALLDDLILWRSHEAKETNGA